MATKKKKRIASAAPRKAGVKRRITASIRERVLGEFLESTGAPNLDALREAYENGKRAGRAETPRQDYEIVDEPEPPKPDPEAKAHAKLRKARHTFAEAKGEVYAARASLSRAQEKLANAERWDMMCEMALTAALLEYGPGPGEEDE